MTSPSADGTSEKSAKTIPQFSACLEAAGIPAPGPNRRAFVCSHDGSLWSPGIPIGSFPYLPISEQGDWATAGLGREKQAALGWLGAHRVNTLAGFPHRSLFKDAKGVSGFVWNTGRGMTLRCPHTIEQPAPQWQSLSHKVDPTDFSISLPDPESCVSLPARVRGWHLQLPGQREAFPGRCTVFTSYKGSTGHTLPCRKRAACFSECFSESNYPDEAKWPCVWSLGLCIRNAEVRC